MTEKGSSPPLGAFADSAPPPPPQREAAEDEANKRFKSTLVGVPASTPPPRPSSPPPSIPVLSPPPWRGAQAYADGNVPEPRQSAVPPPPTVGDLVAPVAAPPASAPAAPLANSSAAARGSIRDSIERMLDEQLPSGAGATTTAVAEAPPLGSVASAGEEGAADLDIDTSLEDEIEDYHSEPPAPRSMPPARTPSGRPIALSTPPARTPSGRPIALSLPVPASAKLSDGGSDRPLNFMPLDSVRPPAAAAAVAAAPPIGSLRAAPPPIVADPLAPPVPELSIALPGAAPVSGGASLASRVAPDLLRPPSVAPTPSSTGVGLLYVGLMVVLGVGGYMVTRGGFVPQRRPEARPVASVTPPALAQVPAAVKPGDTPPPPAAPAAEPAPAPAAAPEPTVAVAAPVPAPTPAPSGPVVAPPPAPAPAAVAAVQPAKAVAPVPAAPAPPSAPRTMVAAPLPPPAPAPTPSVAPATPAPSEPAPVATTLQPLTEPEPIVPTRDKPTREDVQAALEGVRPAVTACAPGKRGTAQVDITVAGSGIITRALVGGDFAGTPEGSCMARAVRGARLPAFSQPTFRVIYPFAL